MPWSTAVRTILIASRSSTRGGARGQPPTPIAETRSPVRPSVRCGIIDGIRRTAPVERVAQTFLELNRRRVAEERFRLRDVGLRILDVAGALLLVDWLQVRADDRVHHAEQFVQR